MEGKVRKLPCSDRLGKRKASGRGCLQGGEKATGGREGRETQAEWGNRVW